MKEDAVLVYPLSFALDVKYPVQYYVGLSAYGNKSSYLVGHETLSYLIASM
jgi:hypothetical protein